MIKKHVILLETTNNVWVAYSVSNLEANRMSKAILPHLNYYVFECNLLQQYPYTMKLKYPLNLYYRDNNIIIYREEEFAEQEEYLIVKYDDPDGGADLYVRHFKCK